MKAVAFNLPDQNGEWQNLKYYHGKWLVVYFYPADDTPGCTAEACSFRDTFYELHEAGVAVLGVSNDSVASHKKFAAKYNLNFPLLSDERGEMLQAYGAWGKKPILGTMGVLRKTFLINPQGDIVRVYEHVNPLGHARRILKDFKALTA